MNVTDLITLFAVCYLSFLMVYESILNFIPFKQTKETSFIYFQKVIPNLQFNTSPLRGPPIA